MKIQLLVAALGALIAVIAYDYVPFAEDGAGCAADSDPECPDAFFSADYWQARHRFRTRAAAAGGSLRSYVVAVDARTGLDYTIDTAFFPAARAEGRAENETTLLHVSGTHGVEAFVGSAIQLRLL